MQLPSAVTREAAVARHLLSHPGETTYRLARHLRIPLSTARDARRRVEAAAGGDLQAFLAKHPPRLREVVLDHPAPERWLARPPARLSLSGEDAAAVEGMDLVPRRHLFYVAEEDLALVVESLRRTGAVGVGPGEGNITLRVRDPFLLDDPAPLVERGQRLLDYAESKNLHLRRSLGLAP